MELHRLAVERYNANPTPHNARRVTAARREAIRRAARFDRIRRLLAVTSEETTR